VPMPVGAARVVKLTRPGSGLAEEITLDGFEFLANPTQPSLFYGGYTNEDRGGIITQGARRIHLANCKAGLIYPGNAERITLERCDFGDVEVDKLLSSAVFDKSTLRLVYGGTGVRSTTFRDCDVLDFFEYIAKHMAVRVEKCRFFSVHDSGAKATAHGQSVKFEQCEFIHRAGENQIPIGGGAAIEMVEATGAGSGYIELDLDPATLIPFDRLCEGQRIFTPGHAKSGVISAIYWTGSKVKVEASFNVDPVIGDVFTVKQQRDFSVQDCFETDRAQRVRPVAINPNASGVEFYRNNVEAERIQKVVVPFNGSISGGETAVAIDGYLLGALMVVTRTVAGQRFQFWAGPSGGTYFLREVDCEYPGARQVYATKAGDGAQGADGLAQIPFQFTDRVTIQWSADPGTAEGYLVFEVLRKV
jgi:hypothetical protein